MFKSVEWLELTRAKEKHQGLKSIYKAEPRQK